MDKKTLLIDLEKLDVELLPYIKSDEHICPNSLLHILLHCVYIKTPENSEV